MAKTIHYICHSTCLYIHWTVEPKITHKPFEPNIRN